MDTYGWTRKRYPVIPAYYQPVKRGLWDEVSEWLFPIRLSLQDKHSAFINLYWHTGAWKAFLLNVAAGTHHFRHSSQKYSHTALA